MVYLETDRLILRDYKPEDSPAYCRLKSDKEAMHYLEDILIHSPQEAEEELAGLFTDMASDKRRFYFLHMETKDHRQIGSVGYTVQEWTPHGKLVHAGYFSYPEWWGQGYMTEALAAVLEFAFTKDDVYRFETGCVTENAGSERVMQKCGLIKEGTLIDAVWHENKLKTRVLYRLLSSEWKALRQG